MKQTVITFSLLFGLIACTNGTSSSGGVNTNTIPTQGLVAYYPFNGNTNDSSGNAHNGVNAGATLTSDRFGHANSAYAFDGTNEIVVPHSDALNIVGDMTISAWFNSSGPPLFRTSHTIVAKRTQTGYGTPGFGTFPYLLSINYQYSIPSDYKKPLFACAANDAYQYLEATPAADTISNNTWNHIVCTIAGNNMKFFINGVERFDTTINNQNRLGNTYPLLIGSGGRTDKPAEQFVGALDDIRIYNRALTVVEIQSLYHEGGW